MQSERATIETTVTHILVTRVLFEVQSQHISAEVPLRDEFDMDSISFLELRAQLEDEYALDIPDEDFTPENFATVAQLARYLSTRIEKK